MLDQSLWRPSSRYCDISRFYIRACEEALAIRRVFSLVDMITNTKFYTALLFLKLVRFGSKICIVSMKIRFKAIYH